jgi:hypothetical protein
MDFSHETSAIEKACYSLSYSKIDKRSIRNLLKATIADALSALGYSQVYNKKITYTLFDEQNNKLKAKTKGTLDILFFKGKKQIAVEVNRSSVIRLRSAMKLIASGAHLRIAVLYPRKSGIVQDKTINTRISNIKKAKNITSPILVINLADKKSYYV